MRPLTAWFNQLDCSWLNHAVGGRAGASKDGAVPEEHLFWFFPILFVKHLQPVYHIERLQFLWNTVWLNQFPLINKKRKTYHKINAQIVQFFCNVMRCFNSVVCSAFVVCLFWLQTSFCHQTINNEQTLPAKLKEQIALVGKYEVKYSQSLFIKSFKANTIDKFNNLYI